jgi:integrase
MQVGAGGRRGPSVGVRVSSKRQKEPIVLTPSQVAAGVALLEMRDQLLVFMDGSLGIRRGELGALRWTDCDFETDSFNICHSYYWLQGGTSEGHEINRFRKAIADASRPQTGPAGVESAEPLQPSGGFHFPVSCAQREKAIGSRGGTSKKNPACFSAAGNFRCWLAYLQTLGWNHAR